LNDKQIYTSAGKVYLEELTMSGKKLSRRDMLKVLGTATAASVLPIQIAKATPRFQTDTATVTFMINSNELSDDEINQFHEANPDITFSRIDYDQTRFYAMLAAGTAPDIVRVQAPTIPQYVARNLLLDLTPYFEASSVLQPDDLMPVNDYYRADGPLAIGQGNRYGMVKDWSPDMTIWVNAAFLEEAGFTVDPTERLTYQELADIARATVQKVGDRVLVHGLLFANAGAWIDRVWMAMLLEKETSLYSEDFRTISLRDNPDVLDVIRYYYDLTAEGISDSVIAPLSAGWQGEAFVNGQAACLQYGYWFTPMGNTGEAEGQAVMLPAPTWADNPVSPCITATGGVITAGTQNPEAAWRVFEWYFGQEPAHNRASSGWGVPGLRSLLDLIPNETDFQQATRAVLDAELEHNYTIPFNPYLIQPEPTPVAASYMTNLEAALTGAMTFDELIEVVERESQEAIDEGIASAEA
jgi:multiple sugar transport system substrate-binding protein